MTSISDSLRIAPSLALLITLVVAVAYVFVGVLRDALTRVGEKRSEAMRDDMASLLFDDEDRAAGAALRLASAPRARLLDMVQHLAARLQGQSDERLNKLVRAAGLTGPIKRRVSSRLWRRRADGASLASLLRYDDPLRTALLDDPHPLVRARAAENLDGNDAVVCVDRLIELLDDESRAVRFAGQQALLLADSRVVPHLVTYLGAPSGSGALWALEIAANMPDVRLADAAKPYLQSHDPAHRAMAIEALVAWVDDVAVLGERLSDESALVRAAAARAAGTIRAQTLAAQVGRLLTDNAWDVRLAAGNALLAMGATGIVTLRSYASNQYDPFAAEMAAFILSGAQSGSSLGPTTKNDADGHEQGAARSIHLATVGS